MRTPPWIGSLALGVLGLVFGSAAHASEVKLPFEKYTLDNGLEVILAQDQRVPVVHVQLWYHVGSKDERLGKTGFAHLFEHMMFQGSRHLAEDTWFKRLDAVGGYGINGTTNTERTNYFESVPSNQLGLALWMESDRMGFLLDRVTDKAFQNQQDVVRNERRQSYEMRPYGMSYKAIVEALYPTAHPYHHTTIGEHEDLQKASLEDVKAFFRTFYVPANATLAIVGDFKRDEAKKLVQTYFGSLPKVALPTRPRVERVTSPVTRTIKMEANVQLPQVEYVWHAPVAFAADEPPVDLLSIVLGDGKASRLYKKLVYELQIAQAVNVSFDSLEHGGQFDITVDVKPGHTIAEVRQVLDAELAATEKQPVTAAELSRAKSKLEAVVVRGLETNVGRATFLERSNHYTRNPAAGLEQLDQYVAVTPESLLAATQRLFAQPKLVVTVEPNKDAPLGGRVVAQNQEKK